MSALQYSILITLILHDDGAHFTVQHTEIDTAVCSAYLRQTARPHLAQQHKHATWPKLHSLHHIHIIGKIHIEF